MTEQLQRRDHHAPRKTIYPIECHPRGNPRADHDPLRAPSL